MGDTAAADASKALLQTGAGITGDTWIFSQTYRNNAYGIKYAYDTSSTNDKIEFYGNKQVNSVNTPTVQINLNTGDTTIAGDTSIAGAASITGDASITGATIIQSTNKQENSTGYALQVSGDITGNKVFNAVWNDYAEYRECEDLLPGTCVQENNNGHLSQANTRLIPGASIITDTFGYIQGKTDKAITPIAVCGRVLAYPYLPREQYQAGQAVCSAPNGTVDIMTREEIRDYPDAIVGIVSEIPDYEIWGSGKVKVDGRIWIKIK